MCVCVYVCVTGSEFSESAQGKRPIFLLTDVMEILSGCSLASKWRMSPPINHRAAAADRRLPPHLHQESLLLTENHRLLDLFSVCTEDLSSGRCVLLSESGLHLQIFQIFHPLTDSRGRREQWWHCPLRHVNKLQLRSPGTSFRTQHRQSQRPLLSVSFLMIWRVLFYAAPLQPQAEVKGHLHAVFHNLSTSICITHSVHQSLGSRCSRSSTII